MLGAFLIGMLQHQSDNDLLGGKFCRVESKYLYTICREENESSIRERVDWPHQFNNNNNTKVTNGFLFTKLINLPYLLVRWFITRISHSNLVYLLCRNLLHSNNLFNWNNVFVFSSSSSSNENIWGYAIFCTQPIDNQCVVFVVAHTTITGKTLPRILYKLVLYTRLCKFYTIIDKFCMLSRWKFAWRFLFASYCVYICYTDHEILSQFYKFTKNTNLHHL